jgi:alkanesulfonate monooxygenase SsuD/methylene tetrahydromethanopterin reductase-like flavin-dependent oxidoreductase (luciferase family)
MRGVQETAANGGIPVGWLLTPGKTPLGETLEHVRLLEELGFPVVWMGEAFREVVVPLAAAAASTSRVELGSGILQIYPVHPVMVAQQAAQIAQASDGRFVLGLGLGVGFVIERWFGVEYERPLTRMREFLQVVRGIHRAPADGPFSFEGKVFNVRKNPASFLAEPVHVPLYLAAIGPKMLELAGELADGVVIGAVNSPEYMAHVQERLAAGAERAGRDVRDVDIVYGIPCAVDEDEERAVQIGRGTLVYSTQYAHYQGVWRREGHIELVEEIAAHVRAHEMDAALGLVPDELLWRYTVTGTPAQCAQRIQRYADYPGRPILSLLPFRMSDDEAMEALRAGARALPTHL